MDLFNYAVVEQIKWIWGDVLNNIFKKKKKNYADCGPLIYFVRFNTFFKNDDNKWNNTSNVKRQQIWRLGNVNLTKKQKIK